jgi:subtilisin family serine protease/chitodextrinase
MTSGFKNSLNYSTSIRLIILVFLFVISMSLQGVSELVIPVSENNQIQNKLVVSNNQYNDVNPIGYIFPYSWDDNNLLSQDENANGVEDYIENMRPKFNDHEYLNTIVTLDSPATEKLITGLEDLGCIINHEFTIINAMGVSIPVDMINHIGSIPGVDLVQSVHKVKHNLNQAVPLTRASQGTLKSSGYDGITGAGVTIAVIDSGVDGDHNTFGSNQIVAFKDFYNNQDDLDPTDGMNAVDYEYHGCAVGSGTYDGPAIEAYLIPVAVDDTYDMIRGIEWCINAKNTDFNRDGIPDGPDIISMSMGAAGQFQYLDNAAGSAMDNGVVFVTSAGNDGPNPGTVTSPATSPKVIGVGATNKYNKQIASFSSRGPGPGGIIKPDIVAPGAQITVAYPNNQWMQASGTSYSCPIVAGIAALVLQYDPELGPYEVKDLLLSTAQDLGPEGPDNSYGHGFIDAVAALDGVLKVKTLTASNTKVIEDTNVVFTATASGTNIKKFDWDFDGNGEYDLSTTSGSASFTFKKNGTFNVKVKITNQQGKSADNSIKIEVSNRKPDAKLDVDIQSNAIYEDDFVTFNGSRSWDTPSDIKDLEFSWSFDDGLNFTNFSKDAKVFKHSFNKSGDYRVWMIVRDNNDEQDLENTIVTVLNLEPIADAGSDMVAYENELIHFSAFNTQDTSSDQPLLNYTWDFGDDSKGYGMNVSHSYLANVDNQTFEVKMTVIDNDDEDDDDTLEVTIRNKPPMVFVGVDLFGTEDTPVILTGWGNDTVNDRNNLRYKWIFDDGDNTEWVLTPDIEHTYTLVGNYHPRLLVKDPKGAVNYAQLNVTITNVLPKARFDISTSSGIEDDLITFDASKSTDTKSDINTLNYIWDFGDGNIATGEVVTHRFYNAYKYSIKLTVKDDDGGKNTDTERLTIENTKPDARITIDGAEFKTNEMIKLFGFKSSDTPSDMRNLTYEWDFGDGKRSSGVNATHKFKNAGQFTIRLKVIDNDGISDERKVKVNIVGEKEEEDMYANPTFENNGSYFYIGIVIVFIILIFLLISFMMVYRGKKTIIGRFRSRMADKRARKEEDRLASLQADQRALGTNGTYQDTGMTPKQEEFFSDYYGVEPQQFQQYQNQAQAQYPPQELVRGPSTGPGELPPFDRQAYSQQFPNQPVPPMPPMQPMPPQYQQNQQLNQPTPSDPTMRIPPMDTPKLPPKNINK